MKPAGPAGEDDETPLPAPLAHHVADPTLAKTRPPAASPDDLEPPTDADKLLAIELGAEPDLDSVPSDTDTEDELTVPFELPGAEPPPRARRPLEDAPLFAVLPDDVRAAVLARFLRRAVATGAVVIRQGEVAHALIVVVHGRLQVRAERADGQIVTLGYVRDGEFVGEGSLLARTPSPVHVVATEHSELLALAPKDAYDLAGAFPAVWAELKDASERRTRDWDAQLARR